MEEVSVPEEECLEKCDGIIMEAEKTATIREEDVLTEFLADYENYKFPDGSNLSFPQSMRGIQRENWPSQYWYFQVSSLKAISSLSRSPSPLLCMRISARSGETSSILTPIYK